MTRGLSTPGCPASNLRAWAMFRDTSRIASGLDPTAQKSSRRSSAEDCTGFKSGGSARLKIVALARLTATLASKRVLEEGGGGPICVGDVGAAAA
mmetsp:Transcript_116040/g.308662  ORF Transcript_116040/g.308662 Transcript_116040/m.308662 type:complete len:95 (+) Transcript_116040:100-384(+)